MYQLYLTNTKSRKKELFIPIDPKLVKMYVCGPTVYDHPHIGNARSVVVYDILYRTLLKIFGSSGVIYIRNITDIDDKIIDRAIERQTSITELTTKMCRVFHYDMNYIHCLSPNIEPRATEHINAMIAMIEKLIVSEYAYIADDHVYFDVTKSADYYALSGRSLDETIHGVRINIAEHKRNPADFILWKPATKDQDKSTNFSSPWGIGRPGWHIECSAMSHQYLGQDFDIHGGGADLIFPHHTNEIAQSKSAFPNSNFANYWVHNGFLTVNGEKMSKSLNNFITVEDLISKKIAGEIIRLVLISTHYRKPLDFSEVVLTQATKTINYWYRAIEGLDLSRNELEHLELPEDFLSCLLDDMNTPLAIKIMNDYARLTYSATSNDQKYLNANYLLACTKFIGLLNNTAEEWFRHDENDKDIEQLIKKRCNAKLEKNWVIADQIRNELASQGIMLEDKLDGTTNWYKNHP